MINWTLGQSGKTNPKRTQNEPKFKKAKMNVLSYITKGYENKSNWALYENKPNTNPISKAKNADALAINGREVVDNEI